MSNQLEVIRKGREQVERYLTNIEPKMSCPKHVSPDRITRAIMAATLTNPKLVQCTPQSVCTAALQCASYGLEPDTALQHCHLVPFKNKGALECKLIVGYRGLITLAYNHRMVRSIEVHTVREGDEFDLYYTEAGRKLLFRPNYDHESNTIKLFYCLIILTNGGSIVEVMKKREVDGVKAKARDSSNPASPWNTAYPEMGKKTVLRRALKMVPLSPEAQELVNVIRDEDEEYRVIPEEDGTTKSKAEVLAGDLDPSMDVTRDPDPPFDGEVAPEPEPVVPEPEPAPVVPEPEGPKEGDYLHSVRILSAHQPMGAIGDDMRTAIASLKLDELRVAIQGELAHIGNDGYMMVLRKARSTQAIPLKGDPKAFKKEELAQFLAGMRIMRFGPAICKKEVREA